MVDTAVADRWKAVTMEVQRQAKTAAAFAVSHTLDTMLLELLQLKAAVGAVSAAGDIKVSCRHHCKIFAAAQSDQLGPMSAGTASTQAELRI